MNLEIFPWQNKYWAQIMGTLDKGRIPHALLFSGPEGVGMEHFAICLSAYLLCVAEHDSYACGNCKTCLLFKAGSHPDFYHIVPEDDGKQIKVEDVRNLINYIYLSSQYSKYKIVLINPADAMNKSASNALLKTLEEPPDDVIMILVSSQPARLAVTIRSRCQRLSFAASNHDMTLDWLVNKTGLDRVKSVDLLNIAQGRPIYALELTENETISNQSQVLVDLGDLINSRADIIKIAQRWHDYGASDVFLWLMGMITSMARSKMQKDHQPDASTGARNRDLQQITNELNLYQLVGCYELVLGHYHAVTGPFNINRMGLLEDFIIYWQSLTDLQEKTR